MLLSRTRPVSNSTTAPAASIAIANPPSSNPADPEPPTDDSDSDPESLLSAFLPHIFPDEAPPCLGNPGERLAYTSREHGDVVVVLPDYATEENSKEDGDNNTGRKFDGGDGEEDTAGNVVDGVRKARGKGKDIETSRQLFAHYLWGGALAVADAIERAADADGEDEESCLWRVRGESVIELGAGTYLITHCIPHTMLHTSYHTSIPIKSISYIPKNHLRPLQRAYMAANKRMGLTGLS